MAVLRYRAVIGTASMNRTTLIEGVKTALQSALQSYKHHLEKVSLFTERDKEGGANNSVSFVSNNHYICGWPMLTFDIKLIKKKRLLNSCLTVRVYVASDMLRNAQVKSDTIQYCKENDIVIIDNLFQFCQPNVENEQDDWRSRNAENEILDQIQRHLQNNSFSNNNNNKSRHHSCIVTSTTNHKSLSPHHRNNNCKAPLPRHSTSSMPTNSVNSTPTDLYHNPQKKKTTAAT